MEAIVNWIRGDMGTAGDYRYAPIHLYATAIVLVAVVLTGWLGAGKKFTDRQRQKILSGLAWFHLGFEVLWRILFVTIKGDSLSCWWPTFPCNLGGILVPLAALLKLKKAKWMFYLFGFLGSTITFIIPEGIYVREVLTFPILKSILQHTGLLLIPMFELTSGTWRPNYRHYPWVMGGCVIHTLNCEVIDRLLGFTGDYLFFRSTLPFVIPGLPQWITISVLAVIVLWLACVLGDVKAFRAALAYRREKKDRQRRLAG